MKKIDLIKSLDKLATQLKEEIGRMKPYTPEPGDAETEAAMTAASIQQLTKRILDN